MTKHTKNGFHDYLSDTWDGNRWGKSAKAGPSCHASHPELSIGGGTLVGASCNYPRAGYDVYVGFDWGMRIPAPPAPWNPGTEAAAPAAIHAKFEITDHSVPKDKAEFDRMLAWLTDQLAAGKRVHIGCIGGHGRTGLVMAALAKTILGKEDAIEWVRERHCKKAVESTSQVDWLHQHYGIKKAKGSKSWSSHSYGASGRYPVPSSAPFTAAPGDAPGGLRAGALFAPMDGASVFDRD